jgi:hypothetical protein
MSKTEEEKSKNRKEVIRLVFEKRHTRGATEVPFTLQDIREAVKEVMAANPAYKEDNIPDIKYQFSAGRHALPKAVDRLGPWMIVGRGKSKYAFLKLKEPPAIHVSTDLLTILLPDATPQIVLEYGGQDEQGILARVHYNRLLDTFLELTCYHIQNHWRSSARARGQSEIDDLYVAVNTRGRQFVIPIEAKTDAEQLSKTQIFHNIELARQKYPQLIMRPVGIKEMPDQSLVLIEFEPSEHPDNVKIRQMRRYKLVPMSEIPLERQQAAE